MPRSTILALGLACAAWATGPAAAEELQGEGFGPSLAETELEASRGGTETAGGIANSVIQGNSTDQSATNTGNVSVGGNATKYSGSISQAQITGNSGLTTLMQNTGDLVNMNSATSVNVYLR